VINYYGRKEHYFTHYMRLRGSSLDSGYSTILPRQVWLSLTQSRLIFLHGGKLQIQSKEKTCRLSITVTRGKPGEVDLCESSDPENLGGSGALIAVIQNN
jgi:hypothetical protein